MDLRTGNLRFKYNMLKSNLYYFLNRITRTSNIKCICNKNESFNYMQDSPLNTHV